MARDMEEVRAIGLMDFRFRNVIVLVCLAVGKGVMVSKVIAR